MIYRIEHGTEKLLIIAVIWKSPLLRRFRAETKHETSNTTQDTIISSLPACFDVDILRRFRCSWKR